MSSEEVRLTQDYIRQVLRGHRHRIEPSQLEVSIPIITRIYKKMKHGLSFAPIHVSARFNPFRALGFDG